MAVAAEAEAQIPVSAQVVGNAFVQQYYHILHHSPGVVHRFYQDISKLGRPEDDGSMSITTTMQAINDKIVSLNYGDFRAEIKSVDSQESFNGGVHVLVTGYLTGTENSVRKFAQSFFLAPQDRGYFVLNDMFRYLDNASAHPVLGNDDGPSTTLESTLAVPAPVQENHVSEQSTPPTEEAVVGEVYDPPENGDAPIVKEEIPVAEVVNEVEDVKQIVVESSAKIEDVPKKSYASIVMHLREGVAKGPHPRTVPVRPPPAKSIEQGPDGIVSSSKSVNIAEGMQLKESVGALPPQRVIPSKTPLKNVEQANPTSTPATNGPVSSPESVDNGNSQDSESDGYSIYIKGLPTNASEALLEEVFRKFGSIKNDGVQVRSNRMQQQAFCFGFVEFEEASSVQKALEASPVTIGGRQAFVEEKRSTYSRGNAKGRFQYGRGSGFRNEGVRGRGNYGGGRGYNRVGDFNGRGEFSNRGGNRGGSFNRDGYQRSETINSNGGRMSRAGIMANGNAKNLTPQVSATA